MTAIGATGWKPWGAVRDDGLPEPGALVAWQHQVWIVKRVDAIEDAETAECPGALTHEVLLVARTGDRAERRVPVDWYCWWWIYPDGRFPVCSCCGEPPPCRAHLAHTTAEIELARMRRFERAGVCPACCTEVTATQRSKTFTTNLEVPLGPEVTFHIGPRECRREARVYEQRCASRGFVPPDRAIE